MQLPEPFNCPACGSDDIYVTALTQISLASKREVGGTAYTLSADSKWECGQCGAGGGVDEKGPVAA